MTTTPSRRPTSGTADETSAPGGRRRLLDRVDDLPSVSRRGFLLRAGAGGVALGGAIAAPSLLSSLSDRGLLSPDGIVDATAIELTDALYTEAFPTSPLILSPFTDPLNVPMAVRPANFSGWKNQPGPGLDQQNVLSSAGGNERHQCWSDDDRIMASNGGLAYPDPIVYKFDVVVDTHSFTSSQVMPIDANGQPAVSFDEAGKSVAVGTPRSLPRSTIYGFNGTFPGPRINAEYGKPVLIRFENHLDQDNGHDRGDFGSSDLSFLTHLHNGHTAPESDGNPHYSMRGGPKWKGYRPGQSVDNLYLNWPAGGLDSEKQSFFWFHDHRMDQTGSNVYKGLVGLYPIYDPKMDNGNEKTGYRLPGVRTENGDGTFDVEYDIPLAIYDCRLDDGVTVHHDIHDHEFPSSGNKTHPEWWGKTFFKHFPNHGFVGDIFTINGTAFPTLRVKRRKYRFRFLDASISRIYEFKLMTSTQGPKAAKDLGYSGEELQGQYRLTDGQQAMKFLEVASDGGLVPFAFSRNSFELWPAKRREVVVDFTQWQDGSPTNPKGGDVVYLTNVMKMGDGRMWDSSSRFSSDPKYVIPMMKIIIEGDTPVDNSNIYEGKALRPLPPLPTNWKTMMDNRLIFEVTRGSGGGEIEWLINGKEFDPTKPETSLKNPAGKSPLAQQKIGSFNLWEIKNGGGGWVHPFHLHMEEHRTVMRNGRDVSARNGSPNHPDDYSREDLVALDPSESVIIYRGFRDFTGPYVAHCHNLAHEDHAMMFAWEITP